MIFCMYKMEIISRYLAKGILFIMGWSSIDDSVYHHVNKYKRTVLVFSHTSYADFYILLLYLLANPVGFKYVRVLVKPQPFEYAGWFLRRIGAIPATKVEDKEGGAVPRINSELNQSERFVFLISPKGTIERKPWRSGYYHIAHHFNAALMVAGLDYEQKCIKVSKEYFLTEYLDESTLQSALQEELKDIVPLFPEDEVVEIRSHNVHNRNIISNERIFCIIVGIISICGYYFC